MTETELYFPESVKVKRVPKTGYFGIGAYPKATNSICCQLTKTGFATGLSKEEEKYFEAALELKAGELNKHSKWWGDVFNVEHPIKLFLNKSTDLVLDSPIEKLKYKVMIANDKVASSEITKTPTSIFYVDDPESKAKAELESINYEYEAMTLIFKLTPEEKRDSLRLFGKIGVDNITENLSNAQLMQEMKKDPKKFIEIMQDKNIKTKMFIQELIEKNLLKRKGNYFIHGDDTIASSTEEAVSYFQDTKNQSIKLILESRLGKTKAGKIKKEA